VEPYFLLQWVDYNNKEIGERRNNGTKEYSTR
jgi:hypothetical protein